MRYSNYLTGTSGNIGKLIGELTTYTLKLSSSKWDRDRTIDVVAGSDQHAYNAGYGVCYQNCAENVEIIGKRKATINDVAKTSDNDMDNLDLYIECLASDPAGISFDNGNKFFDVDDLTDEQIDDNWDVIAELMDDDTREQVHSELAPCTNREFLERYLELATDDLIIG